MSNSDQQNRGLQAPRDRSPHGRQRLGHFAQAIDDTLYDAFGQRQVSTMYMPLNQYHVVMEVDSHSAKPRRSPPYTSAAPAERKCR
jgi:multidrug efflux pump subunit AcrB